MAFSMLVIEPLRIKNYMGPKPNANDHIVIVLDEDNNVGFFIKECK